MLALTDLLSLWGFESNPFETYTAEQEPRLAEYFVAPPYLDDVMGTPSSPAPAIVFGARGLGKSAIRLHLEGACSSKSDLSIVAVTYDAFDGALDDGLKGVTLEKHVKAILERMVCAALVRIASAHLNAHKEAKPTTDAIKELYKELDIELLSKLVGRYFAPLPDVQRQKAFRSVSDYFRAKSLSTLDKLTFFQRAWSVVRVPLFDIANLIQAVRGKRALTPGALSQAEAKALSDPAELLGDLELMATLAPQLGFLGWFVLVDKIDETPATDGDAAKAAALVLPMLKSLNLLEVPGVGIKFFLWDQVRPLLVERKVRLDKLRNWSMTWMESELREMVDSRLRAFSAGKVTALSSLVEGEAAGSIYATVIRYAMSSPRELVQLLDAIFREHSRRSDQSTGAMIGSASIDAGLDEYCYRRVADLYADDVVSSVVRLGRVTFTSKDVQAVFKISQPAASTKIGSWVDNGIAERIDDVRSEADSSRFVHQYQIRDMRLRRILERNLMSA